MQKVTKAKWWLQNPFNRFYTAAAAAIEECYGVAPNFVCEGGTLRVTPFLEEVLCAPALHLPLSQSTDNAHVAVRAVALFDFVLVA